jgi:hypothetical protein
MTAKGILPQPCRRSAEDPWTFLPALSIFAAFYFFCCQGQRVFVRLQGRKRWQLPFMAEEKGATPSTTVLSGEGPNSVEVPPKLAPESHNTLSHSKGVFKRQGSTPERKDLETIETLGRAPLLRAPPIPTRVGCPSHNACPSANLYSLFCNATL